MTEQELNIAIAWAKNADRANLRRWQANAEAAVRIIDLYRKEQHAWMKDAVPVAVAYLAGLEP